MNEKDNNKSQMSSGVNLPTLERLAHLFGLCLYKLNLDTKDIKLTLNTSRITGYNAGSLPANNDTRYALIHDDDRDLVSGSLNTVISGQNDHYHIEYRMRRRDSSIVWIEEVGVVSEYDADGRPLYISALAADMSRLKWAEEKARGVEYDFKQLAIGKEDHTLAEENRLLRAVNAAAAMIVGGFHQDYETVLHQAMQMLCESLQANFAGIWRNAERDGSQCCFLRTYWTKEGRAIHYDENDVLMKYDDFLPDWRNRLTENQFVLLGRDGLSDDFKRVCYMRNANSIMLAPFYLHGEFWGMIGFARKENTAFSSYEAEIMMSGAIIIACSISRNEDLAKVKMAREKAVANTEAKSVFLAQMSHEVRTPLNVILGIAEIQLRDERLSADAEEGFREIYDSGNLLLNIINDILDFSKIDAGKMEIVPNKYDIPSLISDTMQLCRLHYESKPIGFHLQVDENTPFELIGDELRIRQILNNLLSNAFKYTDTGEVSLSVAAEPGQSDETVTLVLRVTDTGQGMTKDQVDKIYDEYLRFNMEKNYGIPGTGLGLNITKRLIDMMSGDIAVESEAGKGSVFTVRLPQKSCGQAVCGADTVKKLRNFTFSTTSITKRAQIVHEYMPYGRVLVVDDVESNLFVAKGLLIPYGLRIETAKSGIEAIERIKKGDVYDIVFMDHMMPVMDGIKATKMIRGMGYTHPVVALTANAIAGQSEIFLSNGFDGFISKPIDSRELDLVLTELIRDKKPPEVLEAARRETAVITPEKDMTELKEHFVMDAEDVIRVLENTYALDGDTDLDSYTTAVHGIKSALRIVGETKLSEFAYQLERAGKARDLGVITGETPAFIQKLKALIAKLTPKAICGGAEPSHDDRLYLSEKLSALQTACEAFNIRAAETVLKDLRQKTWPQEINAAINEISVSLLRGEYKKVVAIAEEIGAAKTNKSQSDQ